MVYSHLCWQCFEKNRKCQEHINTLRKKEKLIFLKPILDIKTKTCWSSWKGTKVMVPPAFLAGLSWKNMPTNAGNVSIKPGNIRNTIVCLAKKVNLTYLIPIFNIYNNTGAERAPEFWCPLLLHGYLKMSDYLTAPAFFFHQPWSYSTHNSLKNSALSWICRFFISYL